MFVPEEYTEIPVPRPVDPDPDPEPDPDPDPDPEPDPAPGDDSVNWALILGLIVSALAAIGALVWFFAFYKKTALDAVQYTKQQLVDQGFDQTSDHATHILDQVMAQMHPGTDFEGETKGTDAYYAKVDAFLTQINAFMSAHDQTEEAPPDNPPK